MYKNIKIGYIYAVIHMLVEIICFQTLYRCFANPVVSGIIAILFDFFAFVPQGLYGVLADKYKKLDIGIIGTLLMASGLIIVCFDHKALYIPIIVLIGTGNALIHEAGAIATITVSEGKLSHSAIFVGGGSFGVIIGQTLGMYNVSLSVCFISIVIIGILIIITNKYWLRDDRTIPKFQIVNDNVGFWTVILVAFMVVIVRSFIAYAIPIAWKKELWQSFLLFFTMGIGKALGGILSDKWGARKVGVISTLLCIPFLLAGNNIMIVSIIGVFMFSLTMSITYGMIVNVLQENPGVAFGITTIGLFIGILPVFIYGTLSFGVNAVLIIVLSVLSACGLRYTLR